MGQGLAIFFKKYLYVRIITRTYGRIGYRGGAEVAMPTAERSSSAQRLPHFFLAALSRRKLGEISTHHHTPPYSHDSHSHRIYIYDSFVRTEPGLDLRYRWWYFILFFIF